jgi:hypothetical protein
MKTNITLISNDLINFKLTENNIINHSFSINLLHLLSQLPHFETSFHKYNVDKHTFNKSKFVNIILFLIFVEILRWSQNVTTS